MAAPHAASRNTLSCTLKVRVPLQCVRSPSKFELRPALRSLVCLRILKHRPTPGLKSQIWFRHTPMNAVPRIMSEVRLEALKARYLRSSNGCFRARCPLKLALLQKVFTNATQCKLFDESIVSAATKPSLTVSCSYHGIRSSPR